MGITTFSGPVRSDNGFQEWNGSEWVPVAGGGGGSSAIVLESGQSYMIPPGVEPGTIFTFILKINPDLSVEPAIISIDESYGSTSIGGAIINSSTSNPNIVQYGGSFPFSLSGYASHVTFYYQGTVPSYYGPLSSWTISGSFYSP